jgi:hypothetical protein
MVELQTSTFNISSHFLSFNSLFFGSFRLEEVNVKVHGLFYSESNLLTPSCLCLCACRGHLAPCPLHMLLAVRLSHCIRHLAMALACYTCHLTPPSSPHAPCHCAPHRHTHHLDMTTTTTTTKPCDHPLLLYHAATTTQYNRHCHHLPQPLSSHATVTAMLHSHCNAMRHNRCHLRDATMTATTTICHSHCQAMQLQPPCHVATTTQHNTTTTAATTTCHSHHQAM